jgi:hypothetical protein
MVVPVATVRRVNAVTVPVPVAVVVPSVARRTSRTRDSDARLCTAAAAGDVVAPPFTRDPLTVCAFLPLPGRLWRQRGRSRWWLSRNGCAAILRLLTGVGLLLFARRLASPRRGCGLGAATGLPPAIATARLGSTCSGLALPAVSGLSRTPPSGLSRTAPSGLSGTAPSAAVLALSAPAPAAVSSAAVTPATSRLAARPALPLSTLSRERERCRQDSSYCCDREGLDAHTFLLSNTIASPATQI